MYLLSALLPVTLAALSTGFAAQQAWNDDDYTTGDGFRGVTDWLGEGYPRLAHWAATALRRSTSTGDRSPSPSSA